jgi:hypothetical protein
MCRINVDYLCGLERIVPNFGFVVRKMTAVNAGKEIIQTIQMTANVPGDVLVPDSGPCRSLSDTDPMLILCPSIQTLATSPGRSRPEIDFSNIPLQCKIAKLSLPSPS